jgi:TetR/AcrR family fatty acid metabolism transcriptional regulator
MDDVANNASVAKGTIYNYFESKEDLFNSIIYFKLNNLINSIQRVCSKKGNENQNIRNYIIHIYNFMLKNPEFFKILKESENRDNIRDELNFLIKKLKSILKSILEKISRENTNIKNDDCELYTDLIMGTIESSVMRMIKNSNQIDMFINKNEKENLVNFIFNAININDSK